MEKKKRDRTLYKNFNSQDVQLWQNQADRFTGGNLTLWMERVLNAEIKRIDRLPEFAKNTEFSVISESNTN